MPLLEEEEESGTTEMKIAWRYQDSPKVTVYNDGYVLRMESLLLIDVV
jgi:hypothetical protein